MTDYGLIATVVRSVLDEHERRRRTEADELLDALDGALEILSRTRPTLSDAQADLLREIVSVRVAARKRRRSRRRRT